MICQHANQNAPRVPSCFILQTHKAYWKGRIVSINQSKSRPNQVESCLQNISQTQWKPIAGNFRTYSEKNLISKRHVVEESSSSSFSRKKFANVCRGQIYEFKSTNQNLKTMYLHREKEELELSSTTWRLEIRFFSEYVRKLPAMGFHWVCEIFCKHDSTWFGRDFDWLMETMRPFQYALWVCKIKQEGTRGAFWFACWQIIAVYPWSG